MAAIFRRAMDVLYYACVLVGCIALVLISAVIPWAVFTRYVLNSAASWPEPLAVLLTIVLTFIGAAAAYRLNLHMNVGYFANQAPPRIRKSLDLLVQLLMAAIALFMIIWGESLVEVTWQNTIAEFPFLSVGVTYLPIPVGGACLLLFIIERVWLGAPPDPLPSHGEGAASHGSAASFE
ncbi:MAG TPA: TRAP transporter small permease [Bradyrhizobium sp.]|uniref:TRAP transporter small permease n=1 Tax=Bradyrhizobium sp. TaxID=376 RepID=UPI002D811303|nr:TRAP transporter small permease [Bradyrhizobium sp.]HET7887099.1 TRAP transporter small permease [Bradyrhizobium sp.]